MGFFERLLSGKENLNHFFVRNWNINHIVFIDYIKNCEGVSIYIKGKLEWSFSKRKTYLQNRGMEGCFNRLQSSRSQATTATPNHPQRRGTVFRIISRRPSYQNLMHSRYSGVEGHGIGGRILPERGCGKATGSWKDDWSFSSKGREEASHETVDMKEGHDEKRTVFRDKFIGLRG